MTSLHRRADQRHRGGQESWDALSDDTETCGSKFFSYRRRGGKQLPVLFYAVLSARHGEARACVCGCAEDLIGEFQSRARADEMGILPPTSICEDLVSLGTSRALLSPSPSLSLSASVSKLLLHPPSQNHQDVLPVRSTSHIHIAVFTGHAKAGRYDTPITFFFFSPRKDSISAIADGNPRSHGRNLAMLKRNSTAHPSAAGERDEDDVDRLAVPHTANREPKRVASHKPTRIPSTNYSLSARKDNRPIGEDAKFTYRLSACGQGFRRRGR